MKKLLEIIIRSACVTCALVFCMVAVGCVAQGDFDKAMADVRASISETASASEAATAEVSGKLDAANGQIDALNAKITELEKLKTLGERISQVEVGLSNLSKKLEEIRTDMTSANTQLASFAKKLDGQASMASVDALRKAMKLKDDALTQKDLELSKITADADKAQNERLVALEAAKKLMVDELNNAKKYVDMIDGDMKDHKAWTKKAVSSQDKVMQANTDNLKKTFSSMVTALENQLAEMKKIAAAVPASEPAPMPVSGNGEASENK